MTYSKFSPDEIREIEDNHKVPDSRSGSFEFERKLIFSLLGQVGNPPVVVLLWDGISISANKSNPIAVVVLKRRRTLYRLLFNADLYFGDEYSAGNIEIRGDFLKFLELLFAKMMEINRQASWSRKGLRFWHQSKRNSLKGSKHNIQAHYDLGNSFYRKWLDEEMVYTCAYFEKSNSSLEHAQLRKMEHVCRKLRLKKGDTVVEAGCGWGSLACYMAERYGVRVVAFNISSEQIAFARERAKEKKLSNVTFEQDDYRNISGQFDKFVSVGMLEHVGRDHYVELGKIIDKCLKTDGYGLIHSVGRNRIQTMNAWLEKRIFPGAYPPSLAEMMDIFEPQNFSVLDVENLRLHYAYTLEHWLNRFDLEEKEIKRTYSEEFYLAWRLYLAGTSAAFKNGMLQLFQVVFTRARNNDIPLSREFLYR